MWTSLVLTKFLRAAFMTVLKEMPNSSAAFWAVVLRSLSVFMCIIVFISKVYTMDIMSQGVDFVNCITFSYSHILENVRMFKVDLCFYLEEVTVRRWITIDVFLKLCLVLSCSRFFCKWSRS